MAGNIQETIFRTVDIITEKKISEVQFDKTIQAIVTNDVKADEGEYEVKYQDILMTAFSNNNTIKYRKDENVYILIPQGDMGNKKVIIGRKEVKGEEFLDIKEMIDKVEKLGGSYVDEPEGKTFTFDSGVNQITKVSMRDEDFINDYKNKLNLLIGANIVTDLLNEEGDFGIELDLTYKNGVRHSYRVSLIGMTGNPYKLAGQYQYRVFPLLIEDVVAVNGLYVYINGFREVRKEAVKFSNIEVVYVKPREVDNLNQFTAELYTPKGNVFKNGLVNEEDTLELEMRVFKVGKLFDPSAVYKWFYMDPTISSVDTPGWDADAGLGWRRIVAEEHDGEVEFKENEKILSVKPAFVPNFEVIKCIAIFGGETVELPEGESISFGVLKVDALATIVDQTDGVNIVISSSEGDVFKEGLEDTPPDSTVLTCAVYIGTELANPNKFLYSWIKINDDKSQTTISNLQDSEKLTVLVKDDIINTRNYICEVYLKE